MVKLRKVENNELAEGNVSSDECSVDSGTGCHTNTNTYPIVKEIIYGEV